MSELRVSSLKNASSATANISLDASGNATVGGTLAMGSSFLRNRLINGDMRISQRGTSFSCPVNTVTYLTDRWFVFPTGGAITAAQVAGPSGFQYALQLTGGAGNTAVGLYQRIESVNVTDLAGRTVTVQVNISASTAQTISWITATPTAVDNWSGQTAGPTGTLSVTTTPTTYSFQFTMPSTATNGFQIVFAPQNAGAFTSGTVTITGVQLEVGSVATPFERRQYGQELALCQRYYEKSYDIETVPGTASATNGVYFSLTASSTVANGTAFMGPVYKSNKRVSPSITAYGYQGGIGKVSNAAGGADLAANSATLNSAGQTTFSLYNNSGGSLSVSGGGVIFHWTASAEL